MGHEFFDREVESVAISFVDPGALDIQVVGGGVLGDILSLEVNTLESWAIDLVVDLVHDALADAIATGAVGNLAPVTLEVIP